MSDEHDAAVFPKASKREAVDPVASSGLSVEMVAATAFGTSRPLSTSRRRASPWMGRRELVAAKTRADVAVMQNVACWNRVVARHAM